MSASASPLGLSGWCALFGRGWCPGKLVGIAQLQPGQVDDLLGVAPEVRHAVEDRRQPGHVEALNPADLHKLLRSMAAGAVAVSKNWLDVVFVLGRRLKHRRIKKAQEEYPGIVHFLRIENAEDLDDDLAGWLQEAYDHRKQKDQGEDKE